MPVQDSRLNPLLAQKQDIQQQGWRVYDERRHKGKCVTLAHWSSHWGDAMVVKDWIYRELQSKRRSG